jgi:membrane protein implicated in regulation of membrane protease activity
MLEIYWGCLLGGILFAFITVIFGDLMSNLFDGLFDFLPLEGPDFLNPMVIVGGITVFGGAGILLSEYTTLVAFAIIMFAVLISIAVSIMVYFFYVKPMQQAENSTGFSMEDLNGKIGEITIPVPVTGYGEVMIRIGGGNTNQIAASFDKEEIPSGARVVVIESVDGVLHVSRFTSDDDHFNNS